MPLVNNIPFLCIMSAILAGILSLVLKGKTAEKVCLAVLGLITVFSGILFFSMKNGTQSFTYMMGHFPAPWGNEIKAGLFEVLMAMSFSLVMLLSLVAGRQSIYRDIAESRIHLYYLLMSLLMSSLLVLIYTNDIFTGYVFVEINTIAAVGIVAVTDTKPTITASIRYLVMSLLGSGLFLISITLLYDLTGHLLIPYVHESIREISATGQYTLQLTVIVILILVGLGIKSALFPFHSWLPDAHGSATAASSAILSGVVLKGYIILLIKFFYQVIGLEVIHRLRVTDLLLALGLFAMIVGSVQAMQEKNIKRMIAYSSVAQIGYIYMGIGMGTVISMTAAGFHILAHAFTKPMLFCAADGLMEVSGHTKKIRDLKGAGYLNKLAGAAFTAGTMSMIGIPLFSGFVSKLYFAAASIHKQEGMVPTLLVLAVSTILNALYYIPVLVIIYSGTGIKCEPIKKAALSYIIPVACLIAINLYMGICHTPIMKAIELGLSTF